MTGHGPTLRHRIGNLRAVLDEIALNGRGWASKRARAALIADDEERVPLERQENGGCRPGPHGPANCAAIPGRPDSCACGCDAYFRLCHAQWEQLVHDASRTSFERGELSGMQAGAGD